MKSLIVSVITASSLMLLAPLPDHAQITCFPKEDDGNWGVAIMDEVYSKGQLIKKEKWVHKPRWDRVWVDSARYGCLSGRTCDGFITIRDGKYGYAFCDGRIWKNEFDKIDLSKHVAKKDGYWGAYNEDFPLLPFEFDSLYYLSNTRLYMVTGNSSKYSDSNCFYFVAKKQERFQVLSVRQSRSAKAVSVVPFAESEKNPERYLNGIVATSGSIKRFVDLTNPAGPSFSQGYDSVREVGGFLFGVKTAGKWKLVHEDYPNRPSGKGWDNLENTGVDGYVAFWENGLAGVLEYRNNMITVAIKPTGTKVSVVWNKKEEMPFFVFDVDGSRHTYDKNGNLLSKSGDLAVRFSYTEGPFRMERRNRYDDHFSVYDNNTNELLFEKNLSTLDYVDDARMGALLHMSTDSRFPRYGLYSHKTRTLIGPEYREKLRPYGKNHLVAGKYGDLSFHVWDINTMKRIEYPFSVLELGSEYQQLVRDEAGGWHDMTAPFGMVPPSAVIKDRKALLAGIELEEMRDGKKYLTRLDGKNIREEVSSVIWSEKGRILTFTRGDRAASYLEKDGKTVNLPFVFAEYRDEYRPLMKDVAGKWHEMNPPYAVVPDAKVVRNRMVFFSCIKAEEAEDGKLRIVSFNGKPVNEEIEKIGWTIGEKICQITRKGVSTEYFEKDMRAVACNYKIPEGYVNENTIFPEGPTAGDALGIPIALLANRSKYAVLNMHTGKLVELPFTITDNRRVEYQGRVFEGTDVKVCAFESPTHLRICGKRLVDCPSCEKGYLTEKIRVKVEGKSTYTFEKRTTYKSVSESVWNPASKSYVWVKKSVPTTVNEMVTHKEPDRFEWQDKSIKCKKCSGSGNLSSPIGLLWNGTSLNE